MTYVSLPNLSVADPARGYLGSVSLEISPYDGMFHGNVGHYLSCGASALNTIAAVLQLGGNAAPHRMLDFGAGAGRVTRWLKAAFGDAEIEACDIRESDVAFCRDRLGVKAWTSRVEIDRLAAPNTYDLIWAGSVLTHLSAEMTTGILRRWLDWTNPGGLVIATTHGRTAIEFAKIGRVTYIGSDRWLQVIDDYRASGYGYADYIDQPGYGVSLTSLAWTAGLVERWPDVRLVAIGERAWDEHQDVLALQKLG